MRKILSCTRRLRETRDARNTAVLTPLCDCERMKEIMTTATDLSLDRVEIERRRMLARLRNTREFERQKLLAKLLRAEQRAVQLRQWISKIASSEEIRGDPDLGRLARWA